MHFIPWASLDCNPPTSASTVVGITNVILHTWLVCWNGVLLTLYPGWPQNLIVLIFVSRVAGNTGMRHHTWLS
jgi:hypothetical protein